MKIGTNLTNLCKSLFFLWCVFFVYGHQCSDASACLGLNCNEFCVYAYFGPGEHTVPSAFACSADTKTRPGRANRGALPILFLPGDFMLRAMEVRSVL